MNRVVISGLGSVSALGFSEEGVRNSYLAPKPKFLLREICGEPTLVAPVALEAEEALLCLNSMSRYKSLDWTVKMAILASRTALESARMTGEQAELGVSIGSSRGATSLFEERFAAFQRTGQVPIDTSPVTTLGNISSWVAQDCGAQGFVMSHSVTCSTGLHALGNALAWINSGMCERFLVGASEAPLTPFTVAQMKALRIYSRNLEGQYPCRPLGVEGSGTDGMILGEGAAIAVVESEESAIKRGVAKSQLMLVEGFGYAMEPVTSPTSISDEGIALERAMRMALSKLKDDSKVDLIIPHAPGTVKGDRAELAAINRTFGGESPAITSNKWMIGHTFSVAGMFGIEMARAVMQNRDVPVLPYPTLVPTGASGHCKRVMVNAAGFGGNAVSVIVSSYG